MSNSELVFVPAPGIGHLVSTLEFAKRLVDTRRLSVTVLCMSLQFTPDAHAYTASLVGSHPSITLLDLPPANPSPAVDPRKSPENFIYAAVESVVPIVREALENVVATTRVVGVVLDFFCMPLLDVANDLGLRSYMFLTSNLGFLSLMLYLPGRHDSVGSEFGESEPDSILPGFANPVPASVLPSAVFNKEGGYSSYVKLARRFGDLKGIVVNSFAELEGDFGYEDEGIPPVYSVGPVLGPKLPHHPSLDRSRRDEIMGWLDAQPPSSVVFLCFGSFGSFGAEQIREIAAGLERSGYRYLWAVRSLGGDTTTTTTTTEGGKGMAFEGWAPQAEVLAHGAVGGFVWHCGWNSLLESLWEGVPVATWPSYAEQQMNAFRMVREFGLAVEMRLDYRLGGAAEEDLVTADEVAEAVRRVMDGESEVRKRVGEMSQMARRAVGEGGSSFAALHRLLNDILGTNN